MRQWFNKIHSKVLLIIYYTADKVSQTHWRPSLWVTKPREDTLAFLITTQKSLDTPEFSPSHRLSQSFMSEWLYVHTESKI